MAGSFSNWNRSDLWHRTCFGLYVLAIAKGILAVSTEYITKLAADYEAARERSQTLRKQLTQLASTPRCVYCGEARIDHLERIYVRLGDDYACIDRIACHIRVEERTATEKKDALIKDVVNG